MTIDALGKSINIFRILGLYSTTIYLLAPCIGYEYFTEINPFSKLWVMYMPISSKIYFEFMFPAILFFLIGLELAYNEIKVQRALTNFTNNISMLNEDNPAFILIITGIVGVSIINYVPSVLKFVSFILFLLFFPGVLYLYFKKNISKTEIIVLLLAVLWIVFTAIKSTMFTIVAYMGMTTIPILFLKFKISFVKKAIIFLALAILMLNTQYTKMYVRNRIFQGDGISTNELFAKRFFTNLILLKDNFSSDIIFPVYVRVNQGRLTSYVIKKFPSGQNIDQGDRLFKTLISSFIPRLFWPNKPEAGGKFNMSYYANLQTEKASMNVGPPGEAYGSFGPYGGMAYMFLFGLAISGAFMILINISLKMPLIILWIPIIFYQAMYSMETDSMQAFNSIIKLSLFIFIMVKIRPSLIYKNKFKVTAY